MPATTPNQSSDLLDELIRAAAALGVAAAVAAAVDRLLRRRVSRFVLRLPGDKAAILTRWRTLRRIAVAVILFVGIVAALTNFETTTSVARGVLASSAVLAVIAGFAAQATLSNLVSGIQLSLSQPIRLGDRVTIDGQSGVIEEIGLTYTSMRADDGRRVIYPNSLLSQKAIENATIGGGAGRALVPVPVPPGVEIEPLRERLLALAAEAGLDAPEAVVSELRADGATVELRGWASDWLAARTAEERLRAAAATLRGELAAVGEGPA